MGEVGPQGFLGDMGPQGVVAPGPGSQGFPQTYVRTQNVHNVGTFDSGAGGNLVIATLTPQTGSGNFLALYEVVTAVVPPPSPALLWIISLRVNGVTMQTMQSESFPQNQMASNKKLTLVDTDVVTVVIDTPFFVANEVYLTLAQIN